MRHALIAANDSAPHVRVFDGGSNALLQSLFAFAGGFTGDIAARMGVLLGDTTRNGTVNSSDAGLTKSVSGQAVSNANFVSDVTVSGGSINASDVGAFKAQSGTSLP